MSLGSLESKFSEVFSKRASEKTAEVAVKTVESGVGETSKKIGGKTASVVAEETVKLSKAALSQGKLSSLVNVSFVEEAVGKEVGNKIGDLTSKDAVKMIEQANKKYLAKTP